MRIEYTWTRDQAVDQMVRSLPPSVTESARRLRLMVLIGPTLLVVAGLAILTIDFVNGVLDAESIVTAGILIGAACYSVFILRSVGQPHTRSFWVRHFNRPEEVLYYGRYTVALTDAGFVYITPVSETRCRWDAVQDIRAHDGQLWVTVSPCDSPQIRGRPFATPVVGEQFIAAAQEYLKRHQTAG